MKLKQKKSTNKRGAKNKFIEFLNFKRKLQKMPKYIVLLQMWADSFYVILQEHLRNKIKLYEKIIAVCLVIFGIIRIELIEYNSTQRIKHLISTVQACNQKLYDYKILQNKNAALEFRNNELELDNNARELLIIALSAKKVENLSQEEKEILCEVYKIHGVTN